MRRSVLATALVVAGSLVLGATASQAGYKMEVNENSWISLGIGMRAHLGAQETPTSDGWDKSLAFDNGRIYINGGIMEGLTFEFNTAVQDTSGGGGSATDVVMLDAIAKFEFSEAFNIWAGRMLPPSDRANLSGPYYLNTWNFPAGGTFGPHRYTSIHAGRDDGAAIWGQFQGGKFKYQAGVFQGNSNSSAPNFAARLTLNLLDPEPGYYNSSTYFGTKDIFAIGVVYQVQSGGADSAFVPAVAEVPYSEVPVVVVPVAGSPAVAATTGTFSGWNIDILFEKNLGDSTGTVTLDGAVYGYSNDGGAGAKTSDGLGYFALGGFMLPGKVGVGPFKGNPQATIRYEQYRNDIDSVTGKRIDAALNWILNGHNAYLTLNYGKVLDTDQQEIILGMQFQY